MDLNEAAHNLADLIAQRQVRIVLAESCTAGLAAAMLAQTPGISRWLCGSAVVYREQTKIDWLEVSAADLEQHTAVSEPVARAMAAGVLKHTNEATWSAGVTGHLGPDAPDGFDGVIFVGVARRHNGEVQDVGVWRFQLTAQGRVPRQQEAATILLGRLADAIRGAS